jgi:hypothetical protein
LCSRVSASIESLFEKFFLNISFTRELAAADGTEVTSLVLALIDIDSRILFATISSPSDVFTATASARAREFFATISDLHYATLAI